MLTDQCCCKNFDSAKCTCRRRSYRELPRASSRAEEDDRGLHNQNLNSAQNLRLSCTLFFHIGFKALLPGVRLLRVVL